ncbi:MAG: hypothetical protein HYY29_03320, partial [Chloroflexi bacterium]|nr:hypothetical protein [Chloroflexota bacterium]
MESLVPRVQTKKKKEAPPPSFVEIEHLIKEALSETNKPEGSVPGRSAAPPVPAAAAPALTPNAITVLERRYLVKDKEGKPIETPEDLFHRVARFIAQAEL